MQNPDEAAARELAFGVAQRVESWLKWRYGLLAVGFVAAMGFIGWSVRSSIDLEIKTIVSEARATLEAERNALKADLAAARGDYEDSARATRDLQRRNQDLLARLDSDHTELEGRQAEFEALKSRVAQAEGELKGQLDSLKTTSFDLAKLPALNADLAALAERVTLLDRSVGKILAASGQQAAGPPGRPSPSPLPAAPAGSDPASIAATAAQRSQDLAELAPASTTVWLQFAGGTREDARSIGAALRARGFAVPGEERTTAAAGQAQVRYYWPDDADAARAAAEVASGALRQLGSRRAVEAKDFTSWTRPKPRRGTVELWLEIPAG